MQKSNKIQFVRLLVPAVGPALGSKGVKAIDFCKLFNEKTKHFTKEIPIPTQIFVKPDRTFTFTTKTPATSWLLKKAAGIEKGSSRAGEVIAGEVSLKHIYEIGLIKQNDPGFAGTSLRDVCARVFGQCKSLGIKVVP
ncbi:hypothetical protein HK099_001741 [Clydaea vesicula]|uniref:Large ribosomal subunit protein uL11m n=1 Tax=Clydaea vesicula TaxID=447962 RepID=A0AAD5U382_9FUNG|nr:hypothetical protein HK099_001741 [Clydaea vesicula]